MKNISWRAKAVYLLIAAVLAIGLVPGVVSAANHGPSTLSCSINPCYAGAGVNQWIAIMGSSNVSPDSVSWDFDGLQYNGESDTLGQKTVWSFDEGCYRVTLTVYEGELEAHCHAYIYISDYVLDPAVAFNVLGSPETFYLPEVFVPGTDANWYVEWDVSGSAAPYCFVIDGGASGNGPESTFITVDCIDIPPIYEGLEAVITASVWPEGKDNQLFELYTGVKSWGKIDATVLTPMVWDEYYYEWVPATTRSSAVVWLEDEKRWDGDIMVMETVLGSYDTNWGIVEIPADGAEVHWFVVDSTADVSVLASLTTLEDIEDAIDDMPDCELVDLKNGDGWRAHRVTTSGDAMIQGGTVQRVHAEGPASCYIIAVATYPNVGISLPVFAEIEQWNFFAHEEAVVPQVRWVGEKIVLEKYFGTTYDYNYVHFEITKGQGALEDTDLAWDGFTVGSDFMDTDTSVWTIVEEGIARVILQCPNPEEVQVLCTLYEGYFGGPSAYLGDILNEHLFQVYFLKLEDITLGNVEGERVDNPLTGSPRAPVVEGHNSGIFAPANPFADPWGKDEESYLQNGGVVGPVDSTSGEVNISQDTLLRARVRGWFMGNQDSGREARAIDSNNDGKIDFRDIVLPAGRWVLPDDWQYLTSANWEEDSPEWDIMDQPNDNVMSDADGNPNPEVSLDDLGAYVEWAVDPINGNDIIIDLVKLWPVVGPYSSLDTYDPFGGIPFEHSIVPNGQLNWWDCPMPAAKIVFDVDAGMGYFKEVEKGDVYYKLVDLTKDIPGFESIAYTAPFYALCIPANPWLQDMAFVNNGGYDWNTWDDDFGWYNLWDFVNQNDGPYPTRVAVYSDNHGEAMVWLNGDNPNSLDLDGQAEWWNGTEWTTAAWDTGLGYSIDTVGWRHWTQIVSGGDKVRVGNSTVFATAKYPYFRTDPALYSNDVTKDWTWGEEKLIDIFQLGPINSGPEFGHKLILVWVKDRDGMPAVGIPITFTLKGDWAELLDVQTGAFFDWNVTLIDDQHATSVTRLPTAEEIANYWNTTKLGPCGYALAVIEASTGTTLPQIDLDIGIGFAEGVDLHQSQLNSAVMDMLDPLLTAGLNSGVYEGKAQSIVDATLTIGPQGSNTLVAIWWQSNDGDWHAYQPGAPDFANDLSMLEPGNTYFIRVSADCFWNWALN